MVRIWAEIDNPDRLLLPGMHASMTIRANSSSPPTRQAVEGSR
jgi:hypothetical protein